MILDEATAYIDVNTELKFQRIIEKEFAKSMYKLLTKANKRIFIPSEDLKAMALTNRVNFYF
jgi:ABC-type multidrug transport system fused ATPase/permease subunit